MLLYYKYRTDFNNTIVDSSLISFNLGINEGQLQIDFTKPSNQPLYYWKESSGSIIPNNDENITNWEQESTPVTSNDFVKYFIFTGYTATTNNKFNTFTGITLPEQYLTKTNFNIFTGTSNSIINANNGLNRIGNSVRLGGALTGSTIITSPNTNSRLSFSGFPIQYSTDLSANLNPRSLVDKGFVTGLTSQIVYGTQYQLASDLTSTSTTSTTPVAKLTMTTTDLPNGTYKITVHWMWSRNSAANSARFDITIGGVAQGTRPTIEVEAGDTTDIRPETRIFYRELNGINTIVFNHWAESNGNTTTTSDATIELIRVS